MIFKWPIMEDHDDMITVRWPVSSQSIAIGDIMFGMPVMGFEHWSLCCMLTIASNVCICIAVSVLPSVLLP